MTLDQAELDQLLQRRPNSLDELTAQITPAIHAQLKTAIELQKFGDGSRLSQEQLENCLQLVILYEAKHIPEHARTGFDFPTSCKSQNGANNPMAEIAPVQTWSKD